MVRRFQKTLTALRVPSILLVLASALASGGCAETSHEYPHFASPADDIESPTHTRIATNAGQIRFVTPSAAPAAMADKHVRVNSVGYSTVH